MKKEDNFIRILTDKETPVRKFIPFDKYERIELDLGCGKGDYSAALALKYPNSLILAADVMIGRLRKLVRRIQREKLENIIPLRVEARHLIFRLLPDSSINRLHLLCPDPWPKSKHRAHRLVTSEFIGALYRVIKNGGIFHFSSDDRPYAKSVENLVSISKLFKSANRALDDVRDIKTSFELRWLKENKPVRHFAWRKE